MQGESGRLKILLEQNINNEDSHAYNAVINVFLSIQTNLNLE